MRYRCAILPLFLVAFVLVASRASAAEPPRYDIRASLDTGAKEVTIDEKAVFTNNSPREIHELYFHIYPNRWYTPEEKQFITRYGGYFKVDLFPEGLPQEGMRIESVSVYGHPVSALIEGEDRTLLKVPLAEGLQPGASVEVALKTLVRLPHMFSRFGWHDHIIKLSQWYPVLSVYDSEKGWARYPFYPYHRPFFSEASTYTVAMTMPEEYVAAHTGTQTKEENLAGGLKTVYYETPGPVRDFTLAVSPDYKVLQGNFGDVRIHSFYLPGDEKAAARALEDARSLMEYYTGLFGPYPYPEFSIAPVHLGYGGEQMSNLAFIDTRAYKLPDLLDRYFDFLVAHETGHQWFYNVVGIDEYTQMWLEEGVNSYFILEYLEHKYGRNASVLNYPRWFDDWRWTLPDLTFRRTRDVTYKMLARTGYDHAIVDKLWKFREPSTIFSLTYGKGARVAGMLRYYVGDDAFRRIFKKVFEQYRFRNMDIKDLIRLSEEESGQDLAWFFTPWLYKAEKFDYAVAGVADNVVTLENRGQITMPAPVMITFADGQEKTVIWGGREPRLVVDDDRPIASVTIDPQDVLLDIDRTNNRWPRKVLVKPVPYYLPLYEIPAFQKDDAYQVVIGPESAHSGFGVKASFIKPFDYILYGATDYEFGENLLHSRAGFRKRNVFHRQTSLGFEVLDTKDYDDGSEDLLSGKVYLRQELWPASYGLLAMNDHLTFYLVRNQRLNDRPDSTSLREDARNIDYSRRDESITGAELHLDRSGPYPDPKTGWRLTALAENAGHFWGAGQAFTRTGLDLSVYRPAVGGSRWALRCKYGWGHPDDKELFYIGGIDGLRGYERKSVRGANALLGSVEYRFPIVTDIGIQTPGRLFGLDSVGGVLFFDGGRAWFGDFSAPDVRMDAGFGLRFTVTVGSLLEKIIVRADVATAINDSDEGTRFWMGVGHAF